MTMPGRRSLQDILAGLRATRAALLIALEPVPADACFRGSDRMVMDYVWELLWAGEAEEWLALLMSHEAPDLGTAPTWESRKEAMCLRYWHSLQVVIDFAETLTEADLARGGSRGGKPTSVYDAMLGTIEHDDRYAVMLREENIPFALAQPPLPPVPFPPGDPEADAEARRDSCVAELRQIAATLAPLLEGVPWQQSFEGRGQRVADLVMHCSFRPVLTEITKRMAREDSPELGTLVSPNGFWDYLRPALIDGLGGKADAYAAMSSAELIRTGSSGGRPLSAVMAIEWDVARIRDNAAAIEAKRARRMTES